MKRFVLSVCVMLGAGSLRAQDFIRLGAAHDFSKSKIVHTFSMDFNRTEKVEEKEGRYVLFNRNNYYILPTSDINIGDGVTASENNILVQIKAGRAFYGKLRRSRDNLTTAVFNKSLEVNPSFNSDKLFGEKLYYAQLKFVVNFISQRFSGAAPGSYIKPVHSLAAGPFINLGSRVSNTHSQTALYNTLGGVLDYRFRYLNAAQLENWVVKLSGNYYYIASDINALTNDNFGGIIKASIDRRVAGKLYAGLMHKYGNDNPGYTYVHTVELSAKIAY